MGAILILLILPGDNVKDLHDVQTRWILQPRYHAQMHCRRLCGEQILLVNLSACCEETKHFVCHV